MPNPAESITQWGIAKLGFALVEKTDGAITSFGDIHVMKGGINANMSSSDSDNNKQAADNGLHYDGSGAGNITCELQVAKFDRWFKKNALGFFEDGGGLGRGKGVKAEIATLVEVVTDQGGKRFVIYDGTSSDISVTFATTSVTGEITFSPETVTITGKLAELPNGTERSYFEIETGDEGYDTFWTDVYYPMSNGG